MSYLVPLILSGLVINVVHGYMLTSLKTHRKRTISEHAVLRKRAFVLYVIGHVLGGGLFLIFAKLYFLDLQNNSWLFGLTIFTLVFEYTQAVLPARGKTNTPHTITALIMWGSFITLGLLSIVVLPVPDYRKLLASLLYLGLIGTLIYAFSDKSRIYRHQMTMVILFYLSMIVLVA